MLSPTEARFALYQSVSAKASEELKNLLENKHLYQSVSIGFSEFVNRIGNEVSEVGPPIGAIGAAEVQFMGWAGDVAKERFNFELHQVVIPRDASRPTS